MVPASPAVVRVWARENGHVVSDRGRIPAAVRLAYEAAHSAGSAPDAAVVAAAPATAPAWGAGHVPPSGLVAQNDVGRDGFAVASLILGILPFLGGVLGIVFGAVAIRRIRHTGRAGRGMAIVGITLGSLWLVGITVAVISGLSTAPERDATGAVTEGGDVSAFDLEVGDCVADPPLGDRSTHEVVPCDGPHAAKVYAVFTLSGGDYPGDATVDRFAKGGCERRLNDQFGAKAPADFYYLLPTKDSWLNGRRGVTCLADPES